MGIVNADSEELRRLADVMSDGNNKIEEYIARLRAARGQLESAWRDAYYHKFSEHFEETLRQAVQFTEKIRPLIGMVRDKASKIDEYCSINLEDIEL